MEKTTGPRTSVRGPGKEEGSTREGWEGLLSERRWKWRKQCAKSQIVRVCPKVGSDGHGQVLLKAKVIYPGGSDDKEFTCNAGELGSIPGLGRSPGEGNGNPSQYSCLENPCGQRGLAGYSPMGLQRVGHDWATTKHYLYQCKVLRIKMSHVENEEGNGTPLQYSCLENPMDGGAWWAAVHGFTKSRTRLRDFTFTFHFHALEKEIATHSSVLAWRIPGTGEPVGLPSMGSHRVEHDWSDLAAAAYWKSNIQTGSKVISLPREVAQILVSKNISEG